MRPAVRRVNVLCPGPSLPDHWSDDDYEVEREDRSVLTVGVNTAAWVFRCDMAAALDVQVLRSLPPVGRVLTAGKLHPEGEAQKVTMPWHNASWEDVRKAVGAEKVKGVHPPAGGALLNYTFANVCGWLWSEHPGAQVRIFGFDCSTAKEDFAGKAGNRSFKRWYQELPFVRAFWLPHWEVWSAIHGEVLGWVRGEKGWAGVERVLNG